MIVSMLFNVAGINYNRENVERLGSPSRTFPLDDDTLMHKYDRKVTLYEFYFDNFCAELIPEPDNPEDPNAIAIYCKGFKIGYVPAGKTSDVRLLLDSGSVSRIDLYIRGGREKSVSPDGVAAFDHGYHGEVSIEYEAVSSKIQQSVQKKKRVGRGRLFLPCLFGGWFGLHKFMEGKTGIGVLYLCTLGLFGIGWIIDCIIYAGKKA